jgi:hypothetical protein
MQRYAGWCYLQRKQARKLTFPRGTNHTKGILIFGENLLCLIPLFPRALGFLFACLLLLFPASSMAAEVTISWSPSLDPKMTGYRVYYGPPDRDSEFKADAHSETKITLTNLQEGGTYSFLVNTYDAASRETRHSHKITVVSIKDKDTLFLPIIPSSLPSSSGIPSHFVQERPFINATPECDFSIFPAMHSVASSGGVGAVGISTNLNCVWTAMANVSWVSITSNDRGSGSHAVYYMVKPNPSPSSRQGTLTVAGQMFKINQAGRARHSLRINKIGTGTGTVSSIPVGTDFEKGSVVILTAAPSANSDFGGWSGQCSGTSPTCATTITSSNLAIAIFNLKTFSFTVISGVNGSVTPSRDVLVNYGESQNFIFTPNKGYQVGQVIVDGVSIGKPETLLFGNVMGSHRIDAIFTPLYGMAK